MSFKILTLNNISVRGLERLPRDRYEVASEIGHPDAVLLRSADLHALLKHDLHDLLVASAQDPLAVRTTHEGTHEHSAFRRTVRPLRLPFQGAADSRPPPYSKDRGVGRGAAGDHTTLEAAIGARLITRVLVFGEDTVRWLFQGAIPPVVGSATVTPLAGLGEISRHASAKRALWRCLQDPLRNASPGGNGPSAA